MYVVMIYWEENFVKSKNVLPRNNFSGPTFNLFLAISFIYEVGTEKISIWVTVMQEKEEGINNAVIQPYTVVEECKVICSKPEVFLD